MLPSVGVATFPASFRVEAGNRGSMKKLLAIAVSVAVSLGVSPGAAAEDFYELELLVLNNDGSPSEGQVFTTSLYGERIETDDSGSVKVELPAGIQTITADFRPESDALNLGQAFMTFNVQMNSAKTITIRLPEVMVTTINLADTAGAPINHAPFFLRWESCGTLYVPMNFGFSENAQLNINAPSYIPVDRQGKRVTSKYRMSYGIRADENGVATLAAFSPRGQSNCSATSFSNWPSITYSTATGVETILSSQLDAGNSNVTNAGAPTFVINSIQRIDEDGVQTRIKITGKVEVSNPNYLSVHKTVQMTRRMGDSQGGVSSGRASIAADGTFTLVAYANRLYFKAGEQAYLETESGFQSQLITLPMATYRAVQKTLRPFSGSATGLTATQKNEIRNVVASNPDAEKFICTGIRYFDQPMSVNIMVRKRAKAACEYAKQLNPKLSTWFQNKPTQARSYAGKVLLTLKVPTN